MTSSRYLKPKHFKRGDVVRHIVDSRPQTEFVVVSDEYLDRAQIDIYSIDLVNPKDFSKVLRREKSANYIKISEKQFDFQKQKIVSIQESYHQNPIKQITEAYAGMNENQSDKMDFLSNLINRLDNSVITDKISGLDILDAFIRNIDDNGYGDMTISEISSIMNDIR